MPRRDPDPERWNAIDRPLGWLIALGGCVLILDQTVFVLDEVLVSVRNRVQKNLDLPDGQLPRSTKKEPGHGMGLWNVTDVLGKYQGEYTISCREKWFRFTCSVPVRKI